MKRPLIRECPCCQEELMASDTRLGRQTVARSCKQAHDSSGLAAAVLYWRCMECGCEWRHGQFEGGGGGESAGKCAK